MAKLLADEQARSPMEHKVRTAAPRRFEIICGVLGSSADFGPDEIFAVGQT